MATKPIVDTSWASQITTDGTSGNLNKQEPTTAFKNFGQPESQPVDRQSLNFELDALDQWRVYLEAVTDEILTVTNGLGVYQITNSSLVGQLKRTYGVNTTANNVDITLPPSVVVGQPIKIYHIPLNTGNSCRLLNNGYTLRNSNYTLTSSDNIVLSEGYYIELIPRTSSILDFFIIKGDS